MGLSSGAEYGAAAAQRMQTVIGRISAHVMPRWPRCCRALRSPVLRPMLELGQAFSAQHHLSLLHSLPCGVRSGERSRGTEALDPRAWEV